MTGHRGFAVAAAAAGTAALGSGIGLAAWADAPNTSPGLRVVGAYLPEPASPGTAAAYAVIEDGGSTPDKLIAVHGPTGAISLHGEVRHGVTETMTELGEIAIPAHGSAVFAPGGSHLMLTGAGALRAGQSVELTFVFAVSPPVTVDVPVVPLGQNGPTP